MALPGAAAPTSGDGVASANDAARLSLRLVREVLPQLGYAYGTVKIYENVLLLFCAFLLVNGLDYDPAVGAAWVEANREASGAKWRDHRRALPLLEHVRTSGGIPGDRVPLGDDLLPILVVHLRLLFRLLLLPGFFLGLQLFLRFVAMVIIGHISNLSHCGRHKQIGPLTL